MSITNGYTTLAQLKAKLLPEGATFTTNYSMLENIVARAKKSAIKDFLATGQKGIRVQHLLAACVDEFRENEDLPNTTNPDDWARISGRKGERITFMRTLRGGRQVSP